MFIEPHTSADYPTDEWAIRSEYWLAESRKSQRKRLTRERNSNALILTGQGTSLRIECGALVIKQGFSHYPQREEGHRYFKGDLALPRIIILLDGSGSLSFDVLNWLGEQGVSLVRIKWDGSIAIAASPHGYAADPRNVDWQRSTHADPEAQLAFASDLISRKLKQAIQTLRMYLPQSEWQEKAIQRSLHGIAQLSGTLTGMEQVRGIEGECGSLYFRSWTSLELDLSQSKKYPVPDHWRQFRSRGAIRERKRANRDASDPINAMLNYAYSVKLARMQIEAIAHGYDPTMGIMHNARRGQPAYIFDMMEPERPLVDAALLGFINSRRFSGADFILNKDGVCRLSPQLARMVATLVPS